MKRMIAALLALLLTLSAAGAVSGEADKRFEMAGFDDTTGRSWSESLFFSRMAERTGVSFTFQQFNVMDYYTQWKANLRYGDDLPDVLFKAILSDAEARTLYNRGVLIDLMPYITEETMPNLWRLLQEQPELWTEMTLEGTVLTLPMVDRLQTNNAIWINKRWLDALKLSVPTTAQEFADVLRAFRDRDPNFNGKSDEIPLTFTGLWDLRFLQHAFGLNMNDYYLTADGNGTVSSPVTSDENRAFLAWLHTLWEEGLLDHSGLLTPDTTRRITDSKAVIPYGVVFGPNAGTLLPAEASSQFVLLMPLWSDGGQTYRSLMGSVTRGCFAVTSACKDPEAVLRWVDYLYSEEGCFLARCGEEGEDKDYLVDENGRWHWLYSVENLRSKVVIPATIADSAAVPGYVSMKYWLNFEDEATRDELAQLAALAEIATEPCPQVMLTKDEAGQLAVIWPELSVYCENQMARFVTGDVPLNDETWAAFCEQVKTLGMDKVVGIWQQAVSREGSRP